MPPYIDNLRGLRGPRVDVNLHRLRILRDELGMTQQELAVASDLTVSTVNRIENGHQSPNLATALRLARVLGATIEDLLDIDEEWARALRKEGISA